MIFIDYKVSNAIRSLHLNYEDPIFYDREKKQLCAVRPGGEYVFFDSPYDAEETCASLHRLAEKGYLKELRLPDKSICFLFLDKLRHRSAFWFDAFTKNFWCGFGIGFVASLAASFAFKFFT